MRARKTAALSGICAWLLIGLFVPPASSRAQSSENPAWGAPVDGLRMSISAADSLRRDSPEFQIAFQNAGEKDLILRLGYMLANGRVQLPDSISLTLTDADGRMRKLSFFDWRYPAVAGRVDDYIIPLPAGSIYTLNFSVDQFCSPETKEYELRLSPGKYQIAAQFEGRGAKALNLDTPGIKLFNFWKGRLQSNTLAIER
jgi:hypothetical protein